MTSVRAVDKPREACGVAGAWGGPDQDAPDLVRNMLLALQHRGQEATGIALSTPGGLVLQAGNDQVATVFPEGRPVGRSTGAIGHVRYGTVRAGSDRPQPVLAGPAGSRLALAHNGTLVDVADVAEEHGVAAGADVTDSETLADLLATVMTSHEIDLSTALQQVLPRVTGAYSLVLTDGDKLYGARDPHGFRPLCLGRLDATWLLASETAAIRAVGGRVVRELEPGEVVELDGLRLRSSRVDVVEARQARCLFEYVYFARPDSEFGGRSVYAVRHLAGRTLAEEAPPPPTDTPQKLVVVGVPETARVAADGYAARAGLPVVQGLIPRAGASRTFIEPNQGARARAVRMKLAAVPAAVEGRDVIVVDDSVVRGTTLRAIVALLREAGARSVHVRVASPAYRFPCCYGIDTGRPEELLAGTTPAEDMAAALGCDSLSFLTLEGLLAAVAGDRDTVCAACLTGRYPTAVPRSWLVAHPPAAVGMTQGL